jgi:lipopolysaccharide export system permease protein
MKLLTRYLSREIYGSLMLVFGALLMLFAFFDLLGELSDMGRGHYNIAYVLLYVLLTVPTRIYELFPVAVLIGTIFALVQMAANSELTIYRSSGASLKQMIRALLKIGLPLMALSLVCGEFIAPPSMKLAQELRLQALNASILQGISLWCVGERRAQFRQCEECAAGYNIAECKYLRI